MMKGMSEGWRGDDETFTTFWLGKLYLSKGVFNQHQVIFKFSGHMTFNRNQDLKEHSRRLKKAHC